MADQLHYPGDRTQFDPDHVMGPDMYRCCYRVADAEYDAEHDITTLTLVPIPPAELKDRVADRMEQYDVAAQIEQLFGTGQVLA